VSDAAGDHHKGALRRVVAANWELIPLLLLAAAVYRPWASPALPLTDFGEFFSKLDTSQSLLSQLVTLTRYYMGEGRLCLLQYLHVTLATNAFGAWAPGWFWSYFALNGIVLILGFTWFRRTGVGRFAAFAALGLWATMGPVAEGWIRPTGEPIALIFFLIALHLATNFADAPDWRRRIVIIAACAVAIVFSKEMLVVLLLAGWLVSRVRVVDRTWKWAPWSRRDTVLLAVVTVAVIIALIPVGYVAMTAPKGNYASRYGESMSLAFTAIRVESVLIPTSSRLKNLLHVFNDPGWILLLSLPALLWIRMIVGGIVHSSRSTIVWPLTISLLWVTIGIVAYLPWPSRGGFYMIPFAFGAMFGAAHALSGLFSKGRSESLAGILAVGLLLTVNAAESRSILYRFQLTSRLTSEVVNRLASAGNIDLLVAAVPQPIKAGKFGLARNLKGFAEATTGVRIAQQSELPCKEAAGEIENSTEIVVVSFDQGCGRLTPASVEITASVPRAKWPRLWTNEYLSGRIYITRGANAARGLASVTSHQAGSHSAQN
jgi:hypothetical protein